MICINFHFYTMSSVEEQVYLRCYVSGNSATGLLYEVLNKRDIVLQYIKFSFKSMRGRQMTLTPSLITVGAFIDTYSMTNKVVFGLTTRNKHIIELKLCIRH